jgi:hypothetical protein
MNSPTTAIAFAALAPTAQYARLLCIDGRKRQR